MLKPAEDTPHTATRFVEILTEAGIPPGVVNLIHGRGEGRRGAGAPSGAFSLSSFTGSAAVGAGDRARRAARISKRVSLGTRRQERADRAWKTPTSSSPLKARCGAPLAPRVNAAPRRAG